MKPTKKNILYMLEESNAIEGVYDKQSLNDAYAAWKELMKKDTLSVTSVLTAHKTLMHNQHLEQRYKGDFRDVPVWIGGIEKKLPKIVIHTLVIDLIEQINSNDNPSDAIAHHIQFENIHPFIDGNGRLGRIILNWELVKKLKLNLMVYTEEDKHEIYYPLFRS